MLRDTSVGNTIDLPVNFRKRVESHVWRRRGSTASSSRPSCCQRTYAFQTRFECATEISPSSPPLLYRTSSVSTAGFQQNAHQFHGKEALPTSAYRETTLLQVSYLARDSCGRETEFGSELLEASLHQREAKVRPPPTRATERGRIHIQPRRSL